MDKNADQVAQLQEKLEFLLKKQAAFQRELNDLQSEIILLRSSGTKTEDVENQSQPFPEFHARQPEVPVARFQEDQPALHADPVIVENVPAADQTPKQLPADPSPKKEPKIKRDFEKFIGENLINKVGIIITIIGVGIGAKYAIDHDLISPWTRIILGYLVGLGLLGFAVWLKKQFENFSAVLLSGAIAIVYFITFAAFDFYGLIPQGITFGLMVFFTVFGVGAAITYNRQIIAHIGLVGAYAVPFLLGDKSGSLLFLFSYITIINAGILVISFVKYWKPLLYSSFIVTWLIFLTWFIPNYKMEDHFGLSLTFISIFFAQFYLIFLAYKILKKEKFEIEDILLLLANSAVFYGFGYDILRGNQTGEKFLGLFTLGNAVVHGLVGLVVYGRKATDRKLLSFLVGMAVVFITIAIPVEFDGKWVTLFWAAEVALLFWIGRTKNDKVYELLSYPLMFLALSSLLHDWLTVYNGYDPAHPETRIIPLFNVNFLTSALFVASFSFICLVNNQKKYISFLSIHKRISGIMNFTIPAILVVAVYFAFIMEISTFWNQSYVDSMRTIDQDLTFPQHLWNEDLLRYTTLSILNYSLLFLSVLSFVNIRKINSKVLGIINLWMNVVALGLFLSVGLIAIGELRESYISQSLSGYYYRGNMNVAIRYISFVFAGGMLYSVYTYIRQKFLSVDLKMEFDFLLHATLLTVLSNEFINWMDLFRSEQSYKLGLSILFGIYALFLVVIGIWKKKKHLRIGAIVLFGATLIKLFFYDLTALDTISKTIVFLSLGILLLIMSFLYNKYRKLIFDKD